MRRRSSSVTLLLLLITSIVSSGVLASRHTFAHLQVTPSTNHCVALSHHASASTDPLKAHVDTHSQICSAGVEIHFDTDTNDCVRCLAIAGMAACLPSVYPVLHHPQPAAVYQVGVCAAVAYIRARTPNARSPPLSV